MAGKYVKIPAGLVELYMMKLSAREVKLPAGRYVTKERVYETEVTGAKTGRMTPFNLRIYSGVDVRDDQSRAAGKDSMKVCVVHRKSGKIVHSGKRVNRVGSSPEAVLDRLLERAREGYKWALKAPDIECKCGGVFVLRKAKRGKNAGNEFYGCSNFKAGCRETRQKDFLPPWDDVDENERAKHYEETAEEAEYRQQVEEPEQAREEELRWKAEFAALEAAQEQKAFEAKMKAGW